MPVSVLGEISPKNVKNILGASMKIEPIDLGIYS